MKFVLVMGMYSFGGAERVMCHLANHLSGNGNDVTLITVSNAKETYELNSRIHRVNGIEWKNELDGVLKLRKLFVTIRPDVIISFLAHINIAVLLASMFLRIPVIISERNDPSKSATSRLRVILRKITYPWAESVVFQTEDAKRFFSNKIQKKGTVIPNPVFLSEKSVPFDDRINEIVSVGRFVPQKRQDLIVRAFEEAIKKHNTYHLTFYGNGEEKERIIRYIEEHNIKKYVTISNSVPDLHARIKYARIFIMMSEYEGMPNALMEAMGLGLVCISSDCPCGGPRYLIQDGVNGYLVRVGDIEQLTEKLCYVIENEDLQRSVSKNAQIIQDKLSSDKVFQQWDELIEKIIGE